MTQKKDSRRSSSPTGRELVFHPEFVEDLRYWIKINYRVAVRALDMVEAIKRDPFHGVGKPEPLRHNMTGAWSRRLTEEHRIVYIVAEHRIEFLQARFHY